jgi:hypothetical protein
MLKGVVYSFGWVTLVPILVFASISPSQLRAGDYIKYAEGPIVVENVKHQLTLSERRDLVNHIVAIAKDRYLASKGTPEILEEEATFEAINRYFPISIIRTTNPEMVAGMPFVTPDDLEEIAGSKILSYGRFSRVGDVKFQ